MLHCVALSSLVLYFVVLCYIVLCCVVLCCVVLCCVVLCFYFILFYCIVLYFTWQMVWSTGLDFKKNRHNLPSLRLALYKEISC